MKKSIEKPKIETLIEKKFPTYEDIRLHSVEYFLEKNIFAFEFLVKENNIDQEALTEFLKQQFNADAKVKITKSYFDEDFLELKVAKFFQQDKEIFQNNFNRDIYEVHYEDDLIVITFLGDIHFCGYIQGGVAQSLEKYLYRSFVENFEVRTKVDREAEEIKVETIHVPLRALEVTDLKPFIGKPEGDMPAFICDIDKEYDRAVICGLISKVEEKVKKNPNTNGKRKTNEKYYTFELADASGKVSCLIFPSLANHDKVKTLDGKEVVCTGRIKAGRFGEFQMMVQTVTLCKILTTEPPKSKLEKDEPMYYSKVFPTEVVVYEQSNLLEGKKEFDVSKLQGKTIVVFDLETTGLNPSKDRIVEIGAVKLVDGKFTEKFSTLINPEVTMSEKNMKIHGISNEEVRYCPVIDDVILDFYKFSYGAILCGHNINGFDVPFLKENARRFGFDFLNPRIDTLDLASRFVKGARNNQLGSLCTHFGIQNERAHRAYEDAIATGQLLIRILSEIPQATIE